MTKYSIIVDLEATCCDVDSFPRAEMEVIEIGAVAVDAGSGVMLGEFQSFVRPVRHGVLTSFCRELTSIAQDQVDSADRFPTVNSQLSDWLRSFPDHDFCSWGFYDLRQLEQDCEFHSVESAFQCGHRNVKIEFSEAMGTRKKFGVGTALRRLGLEFDGTPHRGIDDARNIARIYPCLLKG
ncbi:MAG: exonuclease domain-containing protein [Verrucomicrobiia bacterium]|jgi:3'-5' exoribonuclease 1